MSEKEKPFLRSAKPPAPIPDALRQEIFYETDVEQYFKSIHLVKRPGFNTTGKEILVSVNSYPIVQYPNKTIYQYDVSFSFNIVSNLDVLTSCFKVLVGNGAEKRVVVDKVWKSKARKEKLKGSWIFDGSKLAW